MNSGCWDRLNPEVLSIDHDDLVSSSTVLAIEFGVERVHFHLRHLRAAMRVRRRRPLKTRARRDARTRIRGQ